MAAQKPSGTVDFGYLEGFAAGDRQVVGEVLQLFLQQARLWTPGLEGANAGWADVVHTIKGAARGIGANALGDVCQRVEGEGVQELAAVRAALAAAVADVEAYLSA